MSGGVFCIGFGLAMVALVIFGDRSVKNAKRTGVRVSAQVIGQEVEVGSKGSRFYHTKVRFPGPNGQWLEHVSIQGHSKPLHRELVDVWYDPADPTQVTVDEPGNRSRLVVGVGIGALVVALGVYFIVTA
jgi:Protein of unknown function (DUF3592)